ncbi:MAG TPA: T9SS type A sorting domain-containing protein [Flavobacterium sp.]|jgi:hypothetical protein|nr:T9SS type A sorting domain-containing protein [Flavobacterium sp.]
MKIIKILIVLPILMSCNLNSQIINFPDPAFKAMLLQADTGNNIGGGVKIDANDDGEITQSEALTVFYSSIQTSGNITNITGIGFFTNLQTFQLVGNLIQTADLSSLINLGSLDLGGNQLTSINLNGLTNLWFMNIGGNQLTEVDFSTLAALKILIIGQNQLTHLDFSNNPMFEQLRCADNPSLNWVNIRNNRSQVFTQTPFNGCWNNCPNLTTICVDNNEVVTAQNFLSNCGITQPITVTTDCSLGIVDEEKDSGVMVYPNPSADGKFFFTNQEGKFSTVSVVNSLGKVVVKPFDCAQGNNSVDLSGMADGIYLLLLEGDGVRKTAKVMKE